ncbi:MAG: hypothetical protein AAB855_04745 [Patescibacteria group bacterium]
MPWNIRGFFSFLNAIFGKNIPTVLHGESFGVRFDGDVEEVRRFTRILKDEISCFGGTITEEEHGIGTLIAGRLSVYGASKIVPSCPCFWGKCSVLDFEQRTSSVVEVWTKGVVIDYAVIYGKETLMAESKSYTFHSLDNGDDERRVIAKEIVAGLSLVMLA